MVVILIVQHKVADLVVLEVAEDGKQEQAAQEILPQLVHLKVMLVAMALELLLIKEVPLVEQLQQEQFYQVQQEMTELLVEQVLFLI